MQLPEEGKCKADHNLFLVDFSIYTKQQDESLYWVIVFWQVAAIRILQQQLHKIWHSSDLAQKKKVSRPPIEQISAGSSGPVSAAVNTEAGSGSLPLLTSSAALADDIIYMVANIVK